MEFVRLELEPNVDLDVEPIVRCGMHMDGGNDAKSGMADL